MGLFVPLFSLSTLTAILISPLLYSSLYKQKPGPDTKFNIKEEYDYIVVGGGSAGAVVASRLSEQECATVLLLEAGSSPTHLDNIPLVGRGRWFTDVDWAYKTVPQKHTGRGLVNNQVVWPSGKALGGSSLINAMLYVRGCKKNFDNWEEMGATGWNYDNVFKYFLKLEDYRDEEFVNNGFHNVGGPMSIEKPNYNPSPRKHIMDAVAYNGYKFIDSNGARMTGFYNLSATMRDGERCSTAKAYLVPAEKRPNLDIVVHALVTKIKLKDKTATGVEFEFEMKKKSVRARKEVIISAGTTNTAQLLMLSGIGPKDHLKKFNIPVQIDLPVGRFMQDHCCFPLLFELTKDPPAVDLAKEENDYRLHRTGLLSSAELVNVLGFINTKTNSSDVDLPNIELYVLSYNVLDAKLHFGFKEEIYKKVFQPYEDKSVYLCLVSGVQPYSSGTVELQSPDIHDPPLIDPNYFSDKDGLDLDEMVEGMKTCTRIMTSDPMKAVGARLVEAVFPGCEDKVKDEDKYFRCIAQTIIVTLNHQVGTAKMGNASDPTTVVDPKLRVKGVKNLRVADASVMPKVTSGNTNLPSIMIGEKASDLIKEDHPC